MNPYVYPKTKHRRIQSPPIWREYRRYKRILRKEFEQKCVYCRRPDVFSPDAFGVDHYRPKTKFPSLATVYSNLFYCCNACNAHKGGFWPEAPQLDSGYFIPNPCDHVMFEHLRFSGPTVLKRTNAGQCAVEVLDLNDEKEIQFREHILITIKGLAIMVERLQQTIVELDKRIELGSTGENELTELRKRHLQELKKATTLLSELCVQSEK